MLSLSELSGQYSILYTDAAGTHLPNNDVHSCQEVSDSIHVIRVVIEDDAADNTGILINFPTGMDYLEGSLALVNQIGGLTISASTSSSPGSIDFTVSPADLHEGDEITFSYSRYANCAAINHQSSGGTFKDYLAVAGAAGVVFEDNPAFANYDLLVPAISLFNEGPITTSVGSTVTREISIVNGGLGFLKESSLKIDDQTGTNTTSLVTASGTTLTPSTVGSINTYVIDESIISQYGNGDNKLDNGEEIILTRTYEVLACHCESSYAIDWNCEGTCTETDVLPQETIISNTVPDLRVNMPDVIEDVCFDGSNSFTGGTAVIQTVKVENLGTGAAVDFSLTMHNYNPGSGRGRHYFSTEPWVVKDASGTVLNTMSNVTPLGSVGYHQADCSVSTHLADVSQDAVGLVIEPGQAVYVEIPVYYNNLECPSCASGVSWHMFNGEYQYGDICQNNVYVIPRKSFFNARHNFQRYDIELPPDAHDDECFDIDINYNRVYNFVGRGDASGGTVTAVVDLNDTGLSYQGGPTLQWANYTLNVTEVGGTLRIDMPINKVIAGQLVIPVCVSCDLVGGGTKNLNVYHEIMYSSSCSSDPIVQECENEQFYLHCPGPCPSGGATPIDFSLERITLGLEDLDNNGVPDNNNTADPADVELHRSVHGDEVMATWDIYIHPNTVGSNAGVPFEYVYVKFDTKKVNQGCSPAESTRTSYFDALPGAVATITPADGSASFTCNVNPTVGADGVASYDLSNCKDSWEGGDEVVLEAKLTVNGFISKPGESLYISDNKVYSSYVANPSLGSQHTCDFYNDYMNIYNIWHSPYMPATNRILGCDNIARVYLREYINIQASPVWFPKEYRNFVMFDEYVVDWPSYMVYRPGSGRFAGKVIPDSDVTQTATQLIFKNLKQFYIPYGGTILPPDEITNNGQVSWKVDPTCDAEPVFTARFHAKVVGNGVNTPTSGWESYNYCNRKHSHYGTFTYDASIPVISGGGVTLPTSNETCWDVNLNNSSNSQDAENTWFSLDDLGGNLDNITLFQGSTQINPNSNGLYEIGTNESSSSTAYTICADIENCNNIQLELSMGYGCTDYPSGSSSSDCVDSVILEGEPQDSEIQVVLDSYPEDPSNICGDQEIVLGLTSAQSSFLNDAYIEITLPSGVDFVGNLEMEYPSGSGNWEVVSYTFAGGVYTVNVEDHSGIPVEGLPGTLDDPNELNREINLRFVITYPDTGEGIVLSSFGENPCGNLALNNGVTVSTADLDPLFDDVNTEADICPGESFMWEGSSYSEEGIYEIVNYNELGCTYLKVLYLNIYDPTATIQGDTFLNCNILSTTLTALPADVTYQWSSGETTQSIDPSTPDTYTVTTTDINGCTASASIVVTEDSAGPSVVLDDVDVCIGEDVVLVASGGGTYSWPGGETTASVTVSPTTSTDYIVTVTAENGCSSTATSTVTVNPLPNASIIKSRDITCSPSSGRILATVNFPEVPAYLNNAAYVDGPTPCGDRYLEISGDTPYGVVADNVAGVVTGGETYEYSFKYKSTGPGILKARMNFYDASWKYLSNKVVSLPISTAWTNGLVSAIAPANAANIHIGLLVYAPTTVQYDCVEVVNAAGGPILFENSYEDVSPYSWEGPAGFAGSSRSILVYDPGTYYLTVTDPITGCENVGSMEVFEFINEPGGEITQDGPLTCAQTEVTLNAISEVTDATFEWSTGGEMATEIVNEVGEYSVTITDPFNNCETILTIEVTEDILPPVASVSNDGPLICSDLTVTLLASPSGLNYEWPDGSTGETFDVSVAGIYMVTVTDVNGCTATAETEVLENLDPPIANAGEDASQCANEDTQLDASGGVSYAWSPVESLSDATISNPIASPAITTSYTVIVTGENGCTATDEVIITIDEVSIETSTDDTTCDGDCSGTIWVLVDYSVIGDYQLSYDYQGVTINLGPFMTGDTVFINDLCAGDYSNFTAQGINNGCSAFDAGPSTINEQSVEWEHVNWTSNVSDCSGTCNGSFTVDANLGLSGEFIVAYTYEDNVSIFGPYNFAGDILFDDLCAGVYSDITITSVGSLCSTVWPINVVIEEPHPEAAIVETINDICQEEDGSTTISVNEGSAPYTITWTSLDGSDAGSTTLSSSGNYTIDNLIGGNTYCIEVEDANGCSIP